MSEAICQLTANAGAQIKKLMEKQNKPGAILKVSVQGGGCSGMSYKMAFEDQPASGDSVFEQQGIRVAIDPRSALFLKDLVIDYVDDLNGSGFTYQNPNAKRSCGCGNSFSA
jgi:iron-sulfur cluster assembly protein